VALSNVERQRRWQARNLVKLTGSAREIAEQLIEMTDQAKLRKVARFVNDHLKHPDRSPFERMVALGRAGYGSLNGPLGKKAALARARGEGDEPPGSWRVEVTTKDGRRWTNGVCFKTRAEAEAYEQTHARDELEKAGYDTAEILHGDADATCSMIRARKGGLLHLVFTDGECHLLHWQSGTKTTAHKARTRRQRRGQAGQAG
jgi:hypothetical protein